MSEIKKYKLISLVGVVCFPQMPITCDIRRKTSQNSINTAFEKKIKINKVLYLGTNFEFTYASFGLPLWLS